MSAASGEPRLSMKDFEAAVRYVLTYLDDCLLSTDLDPEAFSETVVPKAADRLREALAQLNSGSLGGRNG